MSVWPDLLKRYEREQAERDPAIGPSDVGVLERGGCIRQLAYRTQRVSVTDPEPEQRIRTAIIGTIVHDAVADARRAAGWPLVEYDVQVPGLRRTGRLDGYRTVQPDGRIAGHLDDLKGVSRYVLDTIFEAGKARPRDVNQAELYALGLECEGRRVNTCSVTYLCRDTGAEFVDSWSFDRDRAWSTLVGLLEVVDAADRPPEDLGRAARSPHDRPCDACPWRTACWGAQAQQEPEPDAPQDEAVQAAAAALKRLQAQRAELDEQIEDLRNALAPAHGYRFVDDEGIERMVKWSGGSPPGQGGQLDQRAARAILTYHQEPIPTLGTAPRLTMPAVK